MATDSITTGSLARAAIEHAVVRGLFAAACLLTAAAAHAQAQNNTMIEAASRGLDVRAVAAPAMRKMTPEQWRRRQLAAVDKSQKIMLVAQKQPGLLGAYERMQAAWTNDDEVVFRLVFGQYLSWYQTFVGD